jgi:hypothetical protein
MSLALRSIRYAMVALAVAAATLFATAMPAAASIPSGTGWSANFRFATSLQAAFTVHLPTAYITGEATWNTTGTAVTLSVHIGLASGPCATGSIVDNVGDGLPDITVLSATECNVGAISVTASENPIDRYLINICQEGVCNDLSLYMVDKTTPPTTNGEWNYVSATVAQFNLHIGDSNLSGTITTSGNVRSAVGTLVLQPGAPSGMCALGYELGANYKIHTCSTQTSAAFSYTTADEQKLAVGTTPPADPGQLYIAVYVPVPVTIP